MGKQVAVTALLIALTAFAGCLENEPNPPKYIPEDGDYNPFDDAQTADSTTEEPAEEEPAEEEPVEEEPAEEEPVEEEPVAEEPPAEESGPPESVTMAGGAFGIWNPVTGYSHISNPHEFEMPAGVKGIKVTVAWDPPLILDLDVNLLDKGGSQVARTAEYNDAVQGDGSTEEIIDYAPGGFLAEGTWTVVVDEAEAFGGDYTVTVDFFV